MATDLSQNAVLHFLQSHGGSVKNADLLLHFRSFIRDNADRDRNREQFKKFVNSVASVRQIDGVSYIVLKKQFKGSVPGGGGGSSGPPWVSQSPNLIPAVSTDKSQLKQQLGGAGTPAPPGQTASKSILPVAGIMVNNNNNVETNVTLQQPQSSSTPEGSARRAAAQGMSPITGKTQLKTPCLSEPPVLEQRSKGAQQKVGFGPLPGITPVAQMVRHRGETGQQVPVPQMLQGREACLQPEGGLHQELPHDPEVVPRRIRYRSSYKTAVSCDEDEEEEEEVPVRQSSGDAVWPLSSPLRDTVISTSSPSIIDPPAPPSAVSSSSSSSSERKIPKICIQDVEGEKLAPHAVGQSFESGLEPVSLSGELMSTRHSPPLEAEGYTPSPDPRPQHSGHQDHRYSQLAGVQLEATQGLYQNQRAPLSSHSSFFSPSSEDGFSSSDWPPSGSSRGSGWSSSFEELQARTGETKHVPRIQEVLPQAQKTRLEAVTHLANSKTTASPWYHSTGNLYDKQEPTLGLSPFHRSSDNLYYDQESTAQGMPLHLSKGDFLDNRKEVESSEDSPSTPQLRPAVAERLNPQVRSRMCRSLGADLDQILQEEGRGMGGGGASDAARLNRLHLISSSLSLRANLSSSSLSSCSTPPRCHSLAELVEASEHKGGRRSLPAAVASSPAHHESPSRQSLLPLDPREHTWLVKGAAGAWPDIYSLFREDPSLLNKQDFISGFTVLHWIAKHGDHRVLNTLWYGVQKANLTFNINARSTCGHTPLHIAAMHGNKNIIRLLVKKFSADIKQRDISGKRPWQYLSSTTPVDIFELLGAPARVALGGVGTVESSWDQQIQQPQRRHRRHHLSSASSGVRPLTIAGTTKVKRSTSLAAFLKHKSSHLFVGQHSDPSV